MSSNVVSTNVYKPLLRVFAPNVIAAADRVLPDGRKERVQFDKITARVSRLCYGLDPEHVDPAAITMKVISGVYQGVTTVQLDDLVCIRSAPLVHSYS
jgi:hypothetical protein